MALIKEIMTDSGLPANFWLIAKLDIDKVAEQGLITVYGYLNKAHSDMNQGYLAKVFINVYPDKFNEVFPTNDLNYERAYEHLKTTEIFEGAEDEV